MYRRIFTLLIGMGMAAGVGKAQEGPVKCYTRSLTISPKAKQPLFIFDTAFRNSVVSPSGRFVIHYDATASNPDSVAAPEFVQRAAEEADSAYELEVNVLGYDPPAFSSGTHYDIYLSPLHLDIPDGRPYGFTFWPQDGGLPPSPSGNIRTRCYSVVDDSFGYVYSTHWFDALRITIFHEFFHQIQFSKYGKPPTFDPNYVFFQEMSSVWMEWLSTPSVKDYLNYVKSFLSTLNTQFDLNPGSGYGQYLFLAYLTNRYDRDIVKKIWSYYRDSSTDPMVCIDRVLREEGSSFTAEYERFGVELMQLGNSAGSPDIPDAQILPASSINVMSAALNTPLQFVTVANSLQFASAPSGDERCIEVIARDTQRDLQSNATIEFTSIGIPPVLTLDNPSAYLDTELCSTSAEVYPNPFVSSGTGSAYLFASAQSSPPASVVMNILDINTQEVRSTKNVPPVLYRGTWNAVWDGRDDNDKLVESGEYLYMLHVDGALKMGKIVVVRK